MKRVYMDANATTPLVPEVLDAMRPYFIEHFGNASSIHQQGQQARGAVEHARESVSALLNCRPAEIVFTSGGTESDNLALFGLVQPGDHLITSSIEHHAILHAAERLRERGAAVTFLPVSSEGVVDPQGVRRAIQPNTKLISIMMANNETGAIQPVSEIGRIAAEADIYFHTDAVQAAGKLPIDVQTLRCDLLSISGHKMHAPQGTGILYVRRGTKLEPLFFGGSHERQRRAGTENLPGIVGLGKAAELARTSLTDGTMDKIAALRDRLEQSILNRVDETGVNGGAVARVANTTNIYFDNLEGEALVIALDLKGLSTSGGSACASGATEPSHVLTAMGLSPARARASLRFSLTKQTTEDDIDFALGVIPTAANRLRELAPVNAGTLG
ncbi:MAG TPA: cysteine desulfurase family protein [Alloacidobacterium sp.]|jgi:cysteine desulfurase|nr:cysteine desulfurase family protein [Alloacidobacterium sp.]